MIKSLKEELDCINKKIQESGKQINENNSNKFQKRSRNIDDGYASRGSNGKKSWFSKYKILGNDPIFSAMQVVRASPLKYD